MTFSAERFVLIDYAARSMGLVPGENLLYAPEQDAPLVPGVVLMQIDTDSSDVYSVYPFRGEMRNTLSLRFWANQESAAGGAVDAVLDTLFDTFNDLRLSSRIAVQPKPYPDLLDPPSYVKFPSAEYGGVGAEFLLFDIGPPVPTRGEETDGGFIEGRLDAPFRNFR